MGKRRSFSSRDIEKHCRRDVNFMWLLNSEKAPDHNTIARFRTIKSPNIKAIFNSRKSEY